MTDRATAALNRACGSSVTAGVGTEPIDATDNTPSKFVT